MPTYDEILAFCVKELSAILGIDADGIATSAAFTGLGLDSAMAVHLILAVEEKLGIELDPGVVDEYPTVDSFCSYLAHSL
ncbi:acyl carrier protein [Bosea sp. BIWAKO-01]|uniref:acyl carrier protein n=1 Tax=Bosea sp. BIWAKO-01 TaxID=506668 RepID=UPI00085361D2|nr:acyl carrier protein [Bosea sp. BIWAKO-01]GAU82922.1 hypothetical protein BIWAKO_02845 [Bosea sp. BIWAKO-01]